MVEGFEEVLRNELSKSLLQSQKLGFDPTHEPPVHIQPGRGKGKRSRTVAGGRSAGTPLSAHTHTHVPLAVPPGLPHILFFVLLGDRNIPAVGFELVLRELPEGVVLHAEGVIEHGRDVVLSADGAGMKK